LIAELRKTTNMNQQEHQMIGVVHGSLMIHEAIHENDPSLTMRQQEPKEGARKEEEAKPSFPEQDIQQEQYHEFKKDPPCFGLFSWMRW